MTVGTACTGITSIAEFQVTHDALMSTLTNLTGNVVLNYDVSSMYDELNASSMTIEFGARAGLGSDFTGSDGRQGGTFFNSTNLSTGLNAGAGILSLKGECCDGASHLGANQSLGVATGTGQGGTNAMDFQFVFNTPSSTTTFSNKSIDLTDNTLTGTSLELKTAISDETGSGSLVFATSPTLVTPALGTPASGTLTNCTFPTLNQDTTGTADNITISANNSTDETVYPLFVDGATGSQGAESDTGLTYNPSSGLLTISGELDAGSLDISGNADIDGTLEADAYTVDGTALNEYIADTVGAMVGSNTETNITVTYEDGDNTLDFVIGTLNQDTTGTADNITISANNSTDETVYPIFVDGATGSQGAESDTGLTYNPSSGLLTSTLFAGTLNTAAQGNVTSLGTLTALTVDDVAVDGKVITMTGSSGDTFVTTVAANGATSLVTTDAAAAAAHAGHSAGRSRPSQLHSGPCELRRRIHPRAVARGRSLGPGGWHAEGPRQRRGWRGSLPLHADAGIVVPPGHLA